MKCLSHATSAMFAKVRSDLKNNPSRLSPKSVGAWRPWRESSAFSLTEVVIALGVAAIAFTTIIGLFPLGLNMSKESYEETQAALLAQTIYCDLSDQCTGTWASTLNGRYVQVGEKNQPINVATVENYFLLDTGQTSTTPKILYVAYTQTNSPSDALYGEPMLRPLTYSETEPTWYSNGTNGAVALAKITVSASFRIDNGTSNPQRVDIAIETPGNLPSSKRRQFLFAGAVPP